MTSSAPIPAEVDRLRSEGFLEIQDRAIGEGVKAMRQKRFPIRTEEGLNFFQQTVLNDTVGTSFPA